MKSPVTIRPGVTKFKNFLLDKKNLKGTIEWLVDINTKLLSIKIAKLVRLLQGISDYLFKITNNKS
jgi:hypothetical protein